MFRTDTGNFNRFLTSLGLLLLVGALLVPYFYFHDTETLRIPKAELKGLTPVSREALETRQRRQAGLEDWVLGFAVVLAGGGFGFLWFGGRRLRTAQGKEDAAVDRKAKRDDVEIEQMSQAEVEEKREVQARESVEQEAVSKQVEPPPFAAAPAQKNPADQRYRENREAIQRIEGRIKDSLPQAIPEQYEFLNDVKTVRGSQQLRLDGLFRAHSREGTDVLLELKVTRRATSVGMVGRSASDQLLALILRYQQVTIRKCLGWLVLVIQEDAEAHPSVDLAALEKRLNEALLDMAKASILREHELDRLPILFDELFGPQAK